MEDSKEGLGGGTASPYSFAPAPFGLNHNRVVCLPLVSDCLKLLWAYSDLIHELDNVAHLTEAFNVFPYPTLEETAELAQSCALHPDQVRVWFMVQRLKFGISWGSEEIDEVRRKMCGSNQVRETDKNNKESEAPPPVCNGGEASEHSPVSTEPGRVFSESSPVPGKRLKRHLGVAPITVSPRSPPPPSISPLPTHLVVSGRATGPPLKVKVLDNCVVYQRTHNPSHSELWRSFLQNSKPSEVELERLQALTNLKMKYIRKWFCNRRFSYGFLHGVKANPESDDGQSDSQQQAGALGSSQEGTEVENNLKVKNEKGLGAANDATSGCQERGEQDQVNKGKKKVRSANVRNNPKEKASKISRRGRIKTRAQQELLRQFFLTCQWPNSDDYTLLQRKTGLSRLYLTRWFGDTRYHIKQNIQSWMTKEDHLRVIAQIRKKQK
ncbi:hypothetical protein DPEC_G00105050 [Dallia pectoralis]|uniref:Uncharacterized protein n=1 Tax=Dallia pectoralis TaxID=75939 RepID=A0ACC2GY70_DALPE|nr:hypothetical protein DPEC_G00105050 [Dallia pectoralis]